MTKSVVFEFEKADTEGRYVRGWASVASVDGVPVEDWQSDVIDMDELRKAAHRFICDARVAKAMHRGEAVGQIVESVLVDDEFVKAMGATTPNRGWWIGMEINSEAVRKRVRSGEFRSFSIGGRGTRTPVEG
jgi:hypothetical protein